MAAWADFSELNRLSVRIATHAAGTVPLAAAAVAKTANDIVATAQTFVPVDTGATKGSIYPEYADGGLQADIGPTTHYAPFLEYGTVNMAPYAFMGPALDRHAPDLALALSQIGMGL